MDKIEEVKKLKQLLDDGVITEEDFAFQKKKIFSIGEQKEEQIENEIEEDEDDKKTLEEYEQELIEETQKQEMNRAENLKKTAEKEKNRTVAEDKQKKVKDENKHKTTKWIVAVFCWLLSVGSIGLFLENALIYVPMCIIFLLLGLMACPQITEYTKKFEKYTKYKTLIVWFLIMLFVLLCVIEQL